MKVNSCSSASAACLIVLASGPALAQMPDLEAYQIQAANIDVLAAQLLDRKILAPGDRVVLAGSDNGTEELFFQHTLTQGLLRRGVIVTTKEASATRILQYVWLRGDSRPIRDMSVLERGGTPDTKASIANRILFLLIDASTGNVITADSLDAKTTPFAQSLAERPSARTEEALSNGVGVSVSWLAGSGLTYRHWFANGFGCQVAAIPFVTNTNNLPSGFVNGGAAGMAPFLRWESARVYWILGLGTGYTFNSDGSNNLVVGLAPGLGADYLVTPNLALHLGVAYTLSYSRTRNSDTTSTTIFPGYSPGGEAGVFLMY